jgi:hypothetical protein
VEVELAVVLPEPGHVPGVRGHELVVALPAHRPEDELGGDDLDPGRDLVTVVVGAVAGEKEVLGGARPVGEGVAQVVADGRGRSRPPSNSSAIGEAGDLDLEAARLAVIGEPLGLGREVVELAVAVDVGAVGDDEDVVGGGGGESGGVVEADVGVVEGEVASGGDEGGVAAEGGDVVAEAELGAGDLSAGEEDGEERVGDVPDGGAAGVGEAGDAELGRPGGGAGGAEEAVGAGEVEVAVVELEPVEEGAGVGDGRAPGILLPLAHELEEALRSGDEARGEGVALPAADRQVAAEAPPGHERVLITVPLPTRKARWRRSCPDTIWARATAGRIASASLRVNGKAKAVHCWSMQYGSPSPRLGKWRVRYQGRTVSRAS